MKLKIMMELNGSQKNIEPGVSMITAEQAKQIQQSIEFCLLEEISEKILHNSKMGNNSCLFDISLVPAQHLLYVKDKLFEYGYKYDTVYDDNKIYLKVVW